MTPERLLEIEQTAQEFGNANCWTGTSGKLAAMILELIKELRTHADRIQHVEG